MAFDKAKIIQAAQKYVQKGNLEKAIAEYEKLAKATPGDVSPRMKIAGYYAKLGKSTEAVQAYQRAARIYEDKGFFNKAVAVYKQLLQVDPTYVEGYLKLAEVLRKMGLLGDAMQQYKTVVAYYDKEGQTLRALETLQKMVDLDPSNLATHVKLAEIYYREQMPVEGYAQLKHVIHDLLQANRHEEALSVYERALRFDPENVEALRQCYRLLIKLRRFEHALPILQRYLRLERQDMNAVRDVAVVFSHLGNEKNEKIAWKEYGKRMHQAGHAKEAREAFQRVLQLDPQDPTAMEVLGVQARPGPEEVITEEEPVAVEEIHEELVIGDEAAEEELVAEPEVAAAEESVYVVADSGAEEDLVLPGDEEEAELSDTEIQEILTESDVYVKYGLAPKAIVHLKRIVMARPDHTAAVEKLVGIMAGEGDTAGAVEMALRAAAQSESAGKPGAAQAIYRVVLHHDPRNATARAKAGPLAPVPAEEEMAITVDEVQDALSDAGVTEESIPMTFDEAAGASLEEEITIVEEPEGPTEEIAIDLEGPVSLEDSVSVEVQEPTDSLEDEPGAGSLEDELSAEEPAASSLEDELRAEVGPSASLEAGLDAEPSSLETEVAEEEPIAPPPPEEDVLEIPPPPSAGPAEGPAAMPAEEPIAPPPPPEPAQPAAAAPVAPPPAQEVPAAAPIAPPPPAAPAHSPPAVAAEAAPAGATAGATEIQANDPFYDDLEEAEFYLSQELTDEASEVYRKILAQSPEHPVAKAKLAEIEGAAAPAAAAQQGEGFVDLSDVLGEAGEDLGLGGGADEGQVSFDDVFNEFKKGVEKSVAREDSATHYDLGIAYKEMGLLDDAIQEFVTALGGVGARKADCYNMIGLIHTEKGEFAEAVDAFKRGLQVVDPNSPAKLGLKYELAAALEGLGRKAQALGLFEQVLADDESYRDTAARVQALRGEGIAAAPLEEAPAQAASGGRRISYL